MPQPTPFQFHDFLKSRRSIRRFQQQELPSDLLDRILETALYAPNAHNAQSWRFIQLASQHSREAIAAAMGAEFRLALQSETLSPALIESQLERSRQRLLQAPAAILICVDSSQLKTYQDANRTQGELQMAVQSAAMAGAHLLLAAHAEGLGAVWLCAPLFAPEEVAQALDLPGGWLAQGIVYMGYPAKPAVSRSRKSLKEVLLTR